MSNEINVPDYLAKNPILQAYICKFKDDIQQSVMTLFNKYPLPESNPEKSSAEALILAAGFSKALIFTARRLFMVTTNALRISTERERMWQMLINTEIGFADEAHKSMVEERGSKNEKA